MKHITQHRCLTVEGINRAIKVNSADFIAEENRRYFDEVDNVAAELNEEMTGRCLVMLSGPSSAGKTTTAAKITEALQKRNRTAHIVSLDNFYRGAGQAPILPDGSHDYESLEALNMPRLQQCMAELLSDGHTELPLFDFHTRQPAPQTEPLYIHKNDVVIFEGIHALNPVLEEHLPRDNVFKIFINVMQPVYDGWNKVLARRDLRLVRRMLRDYRFRNSSLENTLDMWKQVVRGENLYMFPYVDTADVIFDTTHAYEPAMLGPQLLPLLREVSPDSPHAATVAHLIDALSQFEPLAVSDLPADSLLREFVGK